MTYCNAATGRPSHRQQQQQPFNGLFSRTTWVSRYQKGKTNLDFTGAESGSGITWAICKSAPRSRQITTPAPNHSVFYRLDALPAAQPTASKQWRHTGNIHKKIVQFWRKVHEQRDTHDHHNTPLPSVGGVTNNIREAKLHCHLTCKSDLFILYFPCLLDSDVPKRF